MKRKYRGALLVVDLVERVRALAESARSAPLRPGRGDEDFSWWDRDAIARSVYLGQKHTRETDARVRHFYRNHPLEERGHFTKALHELDQMSPRRASALRKELGLPEAPPSDERPLMRYDRKHRYVEVPKKRKSRVKAA
jgi:hypothetical protein